MENAELNNFVEQVRERTDIVSVVSRYVKLNLKGGRYWAQCPFHNEKTASFTVTPDKGFFYCFGCHEGGNVFKFLSKIENISYFEAVKLQAERLGISLPDEKKSKQETKQDREEKILLKINEQAKNFYHDCLIKSVQGETGRKYLNSRGITNDAIKNFELGFAPNAWDSLTKDFIKRGFTSEQLISAGLVSLRKDGSGVYDRMRGRIIIPIADGLGHIVGFGGRILTAEENAPKYLNTPETILFNKRNLLFGLNRASTSISRANCAIVVEGYMDAISLASAGIENVVATLGTAFTVEHAKLILKYARKIIFCYDSDEAGQRATVRALPIVREAGAEVSVVIVPDGKDPDEFIRKHGKSAFDNLIKNSMELVEYRIDYVLKTTPHSTLEEKTLALQKILPVVEGVKDSAKQSEYRKKIAAALFLDENAVAEEWENFSAKPLSKSIDTAKTFVNKKISTIGQASEVILRMAWAEGDILGYVMSLVPKETFSKVHQEIITYLEKCFEEERRPNDVTAAVELSEKANAEVSRIILNGEDEPRNTELAAFEDSVKTLRLANLKKIYEKTMLEVENYISSGNPAYAEKMLESFKIKKEMDEL